MSNRGAHSPVTPPGVTDHPRCACHDRLMLWQKDKKLRAGGRWCCAEKRREYNQRRSDQRVAWEATRRDRDPIHRIRRALYSRHYHAATRLKRDLANEGSTPSLATEPKTL